MLKQLEEIWKELMRKVEPRPFDKDARKDGNFNFIHQEYVADAFAEVRKLMGAHSPVPGDHSECGPDCCITGDLCCGGHVEEGECPSCDEQRDAAAPISTLNCGYDGYWCYSAIYREGRCLTWGASPLQWEPEVVLQGNHFREGLVFADANYHLFEAHLSHHEAELTNEAIFTHINEGGDPFGVIKLDESNCEVRWSIITEEQLYRIIGKEK